MMNVLMTLPPCEICGEKSYVQLLDLKQKMNIKKGWYEHEVDGPPHYFCLEHKRESRTTPARIQL